MIKRREEVERKEYRMVTFQEPDRGILGEQSLGSSRMIAINSAPGRIGKEAIQQLSSYQ